MRLCLTLIRCALAPCFRTLSVVISIYDLATQSPEIKNVVNNIYRIIFGTKAASLWLQSRPDQRPLCFLSPPRSCCACLGFALCVLCCS